MSKIIDLDLFFEGQESGVDYDMTTLMRVISRIAAERVKYDEPMLKWKHRVDPDTELVDYAMERIKQYIGTRDDKHLIDAMYYLYMECLRYLKNRDSRPRHGVKD